MRARLPISLILLWSFCAACAPANRCGGSLYYDPANFSCRPCPKEARLANDTCVCPDDRVFKNHVCVAHDGASADAAADASAAAAADAGASDAGAPYAGDSMQRCEQYCDFVHVCLAGNGLASAALPAVISGLRADKPADCTSHCAAGGGGGELALCIEAGREAAACANVSSQDGLRGAIQLMSDCTHAHMQDPLRPIICEGLTQSSLVATQIDFCD